MVKNSTKEAKDNDIESTGRIRKERKVNRQKEQFSYKSYKQTSVSFEKVKHALSCSDYEAIFKQYAHRINQDGKIRKLGRNMKKY